MRVVIADDGSDGAAVAVGLADAIAWPPDAELHLVSVVEPMVVVAGPPMAPGTMAPSPDLDEQLTAYHRERLADVVSGLKRAGRSVDGVVRFGRAASVLVAEAASFRADLIVAGSRGLGQIGSLLLGSVSAELVDRAPCPVLVARSQQLRRVVLATDGSAAAGVAEAVVATWPIFAPVALRVVSVIEIAPAVPWQAGIAPMMYSQVAEAHEADVREATEEHARIAADAVERLRAAGRSADAVTPTGDAAAEIMAAADGWDADLVVIGSRGQTGLRRLMLGSVARNVINGSGRSVLVVRPGAEQDD